MRSRTLSRCISACLRPDPRRSSADSAGNLTPQKENAARKAGASPSSRPHPRPCHCHHLRDLLPAVRAAHPGRERRQRHGSPCDPREGLRLDVPGRAAGTRDAHEEVTETLVETLDVGQHAHTRMVRTACEGVHAVVLDVSCCMTEGQPDPVSRASPSALDTLGPIIRSNQCRG